MVLAVTACRSAVEAGLICWCWMDRVVPGSAARVGLDWQRLHARRADRDPERVGPVSSSASTRSPVRVRVEAMVWTTTWWLVSGRPRQFIVMSENSRCSILFPLEVPGGKWQTVIARPISVAKPASSAFQAR